MQAILDILIVVIFLSLAIMGWRKGLFRTVMSFASYIIAFAAANIFSPTLSAYISESFLAKRIQDSILERFASILASPVESFDINVLLKDQPGEFVRILKDFGFSPEDVSSFVSQKGGEAGSAVNSYVAQNVAAPVVDALSGAIAFAAIFVGALIVLRIVTFIVDKIIKLPVIGTINRVFGLILGIISGALLCYVFVVVVVIAMPYIQTSPLGSGADTKQIIDGTLIFKQLYENNPFGFIIK